MVEEHVLEGHQYPVLAVDFGAAGQLLLSAGLDGCAYVWDVEVTQGTTHMTHVMLFDIKL